MRDGLAKHLMKAGDYRMALNDAASGGETAKLAFVVEVHSDFSDLFVNDSTGTWRPKCGEPVFFDEMEEEIRTAGKELDYLLFAFYPAFTDDIVDAMAINCHSMRQSLARNKVRFLPYYGADRQAPVYGKGSVTPHIAETGEGGDVEIEFTTSFETLTQESEAATCIAMLPEALRAKDKRVPFAASMTMQFLIDVFGDAIAGRRSLSLAQFGAVRSAIGNDEIAARSEAWHARWLPGATSD